MAKLIKTVMGGVVAKNMRMTVFLSPREYLELVEEAKHYNIAAKNDSQLISKILYKFINEMPMLTVQIRTLKDALIKKNVIIDQLRQEKVKK